MKYETVIGLEVHVELSTNTKIFCSCAASFGAPPNTHTCPVCLGHPGVLPVLNRQAVEYAIMAALAINCQIASQSKFDRKNYFYPDSPKAYQISQFDQPIGEHGWLEIEVEGKLKKIGITRLHLEEDAGKLFHLESGAGSLVDFNRVGVPLIEIVSEPDMRSPFEAKAYLEKIRNYLMHTGVSDVKMEEGSLRCDANISIRQMGETKLGTKTELKNLNSFRNVERALLYEEERQRKLLDQGLIVKQETLRYLEAENRTITMRSKEGAHDYRYFPEPDLPVLNIDVSWLNSIKEKMPPSPEERKRLYIIEYGLSQYDASLLITSPEIADFYEQAVKHGASAKLAANWLISDLMGAMNAQSKGLSELKVTPASLSNLINLIETGLISNTIAKTVFTEMLETGKEPDKIVAERGLTQITDEGELKLQVETVLAANPQSIEDLKNGKDRALGFLVGQVMKSSKGKANPKVVNQIIRDLIKDC